MNNISLNDPCPAPFEKMLPLLENVKQTRSGYTALCPAHDDHESSLSLGQGKDGKVLLNCFAGCKAEDIVAKLGMRMSDLSPRHGVGVFSPRNTLQPRNPSNHSVEKIGESRMQPGPDLPPNSAQSLQSENGITLEKYAEAKHLPIAFLKELGLQDFSYQGSPAVRIPYFDEKEREVAIRFRIGLKKSEKADNRFRWKSGAKPTLYGLWRLSSAETTEYVVLVEGESDCHTLWHHEIPALGIPGASNWDENRYAPVLDKFSSIFVVIEPDKGGEAVKKWLGASQIRGRVRLVTLGEHKDPSDLFLADPEKFKTQWQEKIDASIPWDDLSKAEAEMRRNEAWETCKELAAEPRILDRFIQDFSKLGVVGENRNAKFLFLAVTSRVLERPVSVGVKGPSSGGKSFITEKVLGFFPPSAYYALTAMSDKALAYLEESLVHRFLVICEAPGIQGEMATYMIRSLLSEGRLRYASVEKTKDGLKPRLIEREGPTGLLLTTTALHLHPENETRMFFLNVSDTQEQTKNIILAMAKETPPDSINVEPWHALQTWIADGTARVKIPYAKVLAESIPAFAVRLRRDFRMILNLIKSHALLHQVNRDKVPGGEIIADFEDYAAVYEVMADMLAIGVGVSVSTATQEAVKAVGDILQGGEEEATVVMVAKRLQLDKSTAWRRVRAAIEAGFIKNLEDRKARPARLVIGDPLPDDPSILPSPEELKRQYSATIKTPPQPSDDSKNEEMSDSSGNGCRVSPKRATSPSAPMPGEGFNLYEGVL
jgi:hypothetical protein